MAEPTTRSPRRSRLLAVIVAVAALALIAWWQFPEDSSSPAPVEPGAYEYATRGFEQVSILGGARHGYPETTGVEVRGRGCARRIAWRPLEDRSTIYRLCGERLRAIDEVHRFYGRRDVRTYVCEEGSSLSHGWTCTYDGTTDTARGGPVGTVRIDGAEAVHVRLRTTISGAVEGTGTRDFWLRHADGFPLRLAGTTEHTTGSPVGTVDYRERYDLRLLPGQLPAPGEGR